MLDDNKNAFCLCSFLASTISLFLNKQKHSHGLYFENTKDKEQKLLQLEMCNNFEPVF